MIQPPIDALKAIASRHVGLELLLLHGSRATGDNVTLHSDWDFGYLADARFEPDALRADLIRALGTEHVDLADLARAGAQLRFRAARDGRLILARSDDVLPRFWFEAVEFWCDAGPILRREYAGILDDLPRR